MGSFFIVIRRPECSLLNWKKMIELIKRRNVMMLQ